jgi:hypothetical protein
VCAGGAVGFVGFVGFVAFVGFVGFVGFLALLASLALLALLQNGRIQPIATTNFDNEQKCKGNAWLGRIISVEAT